MVFAAHKTYNLIDTYCDCQDIKLDDRFPNHGS